ncbi:MAG TPA: hypothetical protein VF615_14655 [Longimicrobiaceae bacterium]|jgi:hypothetical protein
MTSGDAPREPLPHAAEPELLPESAPCPFCDGLDTHLVNPFGGQLSVAQYWCRRCRTGFEYIKWGDVEER